MVEGSVVQLVAMSGIRLIDIRRGEENSVKILRMKVRERKTCQDAKKDTKAQEMPRL